MAVFCTLELVFLRMKKSIVRSLRMHGKAPLCNRLIGSLMAGTLATQPISPSASHLKQGLNTVATTHAWFCQKQAIWCSNRHRLVDRILPLSCS